MSSRFDRRIDREARSWPATAGFVLYLVLAWMPGLYPYLHLPRHSIYPLVLVLLTASIFGVRQLRRSGGTLPLVKRTPVSVVVDARGLVVDDAVVTRSEAVVSAVAERFDAALSRVRVRYAGGTISFVAPRAEAEELLAALGFPGGSAFTLRSMRASKRASWAAIGAVTAGSAALLYLFGSRMGDAPPPLLGLMVLAPTLAGLFATAWRATTVGTEGIEIRGLFTGRRLVRYEDIADVESAGTTVTIVKRDGERVAVLVAGNGGKRFTKAYGKEALTLAEHIAKARERHAERARLTRVANVTRIARGERSMEQWLGALRALGGGAESYREGATTPDALASLLEDPSAPLDARVGAALALRVSEDAAAEQRIRVAASTTAEPELREALESVLDYDVEDHALSRRLGNLR